MLTISAFNLFIKQVFLPYLFSQHLSLRIHLNFSQAEPLLLPLVVNRQLSLSHLLLFPHLRPLILIFHHFHLNLVAIQNFQQIILQMQAFCLPQKQNFPFLTCLGAVNPELLI